VVRPAQVEGVIKSFDVTTLLGALDRSLAWSRDPERLVPQDSDPSLTNDMVGVARRLPPSLAPDVYSHVHHV
jgi:hypothetical protein